MQYHTQNKYKTDNSARIGWIPYWNLHPMKVELEKLVKLEHTIQEGVPSIVNGLLSRGKIDLAPSSSVCLLNSTATMALPLGVCATGAVDSVYLGMHYDNIEVYEYIKERNIELSHLFKKNIKSDARSTITGFLAEVDATKRNLPEINLPSIHLTSASASSVALTKILFKLWFNKPAHFFDLYFNRSIESNIMRTSESNIDLVIGDEALIQRPKFSHKIDLGLVWYEITTLPFVYAVWQKRPGQVISSELLELISTAARVADKKKKIEPSAYYLDPTPLDAGSRQIDLSAYWAKIKYGIDDQEMLGLLHFLNLADMLHVFKESRKNHAQFIRWQESGFIDTNI